MNEQQARQRLLEGGYFVALGVPPGVEFGIDLKSYKVCEVGVVDCCRRSSAGSMVQLYHLLLTAVADDAMPAVLDACGMVWCL